MITGNATGLVLVAQTATGMTVGDWITLAAVLVALALGVASMVQSHLLQKREQRERLLNELQEWALGIEKSATSRRLRARDELWGARQSHLSSKARSDYMKRVACSCFTGLSISLEDVIAQLNATILATDEALSSSQAVGRSNTDPLVLQEECLRERIVALMQEIANIKTRDIA